MCGIVGYVGPKNAVPQLIEGLKRLEYRGCDSAGVAVLQADGSFAATKRVECLSNLEEALEACPLSGSFVIGHTRWATYGEPSEINSHPQDVVVKARGADIDKPRNLAKSVTVE